MMKQYETLSSKPNMGQIQEEILNFWKRKKVLVAKSGAEYYRLIVWFFLQKELLSINNDSSSLNFRSIRAAAAMGIYLYGFNTYMLHDSLDIHLCLYICCIPRCCMLYNLLNPCHYSFCSHHYCSGYIF